MKFKQRQNKNHTQAKVPGHGEETSDLQKVKSNPKSEQYVFR